MSLLDVRNLTVQFHTEQGSLLAVNRVSFCVEPGEIVGLVGESGCGKSTLMRAVMGILPPQAERNCELLELSDGVKRAAMVFQDPLSFLNPSLKVGVQLAETIFVHQERKSGSGSRNGSARGAQLCQAAGNSCFPRQPEWLKERTIELLRMAGISRAETVLGKYPFELSGGQRQRIVLAIALACEPTLLLADEPTTALDVTVQKQLLGRLARIAGEQNMAMLIASHDFGVIASLAERVLVMQDGKIVESGTVEQIYHDPQNPYTKRLIAQTKKRARYGSFEEDRQKSMRADLPEEFLKLSHLSKHYSVKGNFISRLRKRGQTEESVQDVSFSVAHGEHFGLVGESGCGKTTLARMLCGLTEPTSGQIYYKGENISSIAGGRTRAQLRTIQMVFQSPYASLNPCHTIENMLEEPLLLSGVHSREMRLEMVGEMLLRVGLSDADAGKYPSEFSGGQRQRIAIARALLSNPDILVLDEPVSALDLTTQGQILKLLGQISKEQPLTWIFISHDLQVIRKMCGRVGVMYAGRIVEMGDTKDVYEEPWHPYTKLLLQSILVAEPKRAKRKQKLWTGEESVLEPSQKGCPFAGRCGYAMECCYEEAPQSYRFGNREVACFLYSAKHTGKRSSDYEMTAQI